MVTGAHPVLPLDVKEVTWLVKPPIGVLSEEELIGMRARALAKHQIHVEQMRHHISVEKLKRLRCYEFDNKAVIKDFHFKPGDLVIVRNTAIESSLDKKMKPRHNGPMIVIAENKGSSYIVAEMTGTVSQHKVAKFRILPYFARRKIELPEGILSIIDLSPEGLERLKQLPEEEEDTVQILSRDYLMDNVNLVDSENEDRGEEIASGN
jgi:ABC-type Fe2+-enterobactin transport system substrate-binding protein